MSSHRIARFHRGFRGLAAVAAAALAAGCSTFKATRGIDVGPFAQNTVGMVGEVQRASKPVVWIHLKKYEAMPSVQEVRNAILPTRALMRGVALYSTQIVSIYGSPISESRKVAELTRYMHDNVRASLAASGDGQEFITQAELDSTIRAMRATKTFLTALAAAQPVVSAALAFGNSSFDAIGERIDAAAADIGRRIEAEFAPLKSQIADLEALNLRGVRSYTLLSWHRLGNAGALDTLRATDPELAELLPAGKRPSASALGAAEEALLKRLGTIESLRSRLAEDFAVYRAQQLELDELRSQATENVRLGRITLILWARSHQNLAAGIMVPASIDVMGIVRGAATKAASIP